ncbi:MAG: HAD family hydrolase [Crocosphaera sp.]
MMNRKVLGLLLPLLISIFVLGGIFGCTPTNATPILDVSQYNPESEALLSDWDDDADSKQAIINFVSRVTTLGDDFVDVADRIAVFDNDGTLWSEKPTYFPIQFELEKKVEHGGFIDFTTSQYIEEARQFVYEGTQTDFNVHYRQLVYKPVIGLVDYLKANGFKVYICSGGDIDFVRSFSDEAYGIPPEEVIGTAVITEFDPASGNVLRKSNLLAGFIDDNHEGLAQYNDQEGKPVGIENHIGKRPIIAVGNSGGDFEMFQYTDTGVDNSLIVLINHDDCEEEYKYNDDPNAEGYDNESLDAALSADHENWIVASMKEDFKTIFYPEFGVSRPEQPVCN